MDARAVERAELELHELKLRGLSDFGVAVVALGAAVVGSSVLPPLAMPLLLGGLGVGVLGVRALVQHYLLVEDLAVDPDAYLIPEVRRVALRTASLEHRRQLAASIRHALNTSTWGPCPCVDSNRDLLGELATALEDDRLAFDPASAVALDRLLTGGERNLYSPDLPADELRSRLRRILDALTA